MARLLLLLAAPSLTPLSKRIDALENGWERALLSADRVLIDNGVIGSRSVEHCEHEPEDDEEVDEHP